MGLSYEYSDFDAEILIFGAEDGGRTRPAFNRIRWDFAYDGDFGDPPNQLYCIYPDFVDANGLTLAQDRPLPAGVLLPARMVISNPNLRAFHRTRLEPGVRFFCHEGSKRVAAGRVVRLTGILDGAR